MSILKSVLQSVARSVVGSTARLAVLSAAWILVATSATALADDDSIPPPRPPPKAPSEPAPAPTPTEPPAPAPAPAPPPAPVVAPPDAPPVGPSAAPAPTASPASPPQVDPTEPAPAPAPAASAAPALPVAPAPGPTPAAPSECEAPLGLPQASGAAPSAPAAPTPVPTTPAAGDTLESITKSFDAMEKSELREVKLRRYDATYAYLQTHPKAKDREEALALLISLAFDTESWDRIPLRVDSYAEHVRLTRGVQPLPVEFLFDKAYAFGKLGMEVQGRAAYGALVGALSLKLHSKGVVVRGWSTYAFWLADIGDIAGAKAQWRGLKAIFQTLPAAEGKPFMNMADDEIKYLDQVGHVPPAFPADARDLEGKPISLAEYRGKYVLLDFWATWCKPCKEELPNVVDAWRRWHANGLEVIGIVVNEPQDGAKVREFVAEKALPWRQIHYSTSSNPIKTAYAVYGVPYTMLIGPDGRVIRIGLRGSELRTVLERYFERPK